MRRRLPAGLRWRLLLALVGTSAVTLGAVALMVLPPMQDRLRDQSIENLESAVDQNVGAFTRKLEALENSDIDRENFRFEFFAESSQLTAQSPNARVLLQDDTTQSADPRATGQGFVYDSETTPPPKRALHMAVAASLYGPTTETDGDSVLVSRPLQSGDRLLGVLVAERELTEAAELVRQVRDRFLIAAIVGLSIAALLAIALSSTLLRRLGRLRSAALRISEEGPEATMPHDERRDEVGDLARALARMQEELRRQEAARRAFVSTASHELRTPLTMLQGTMELLEEDIRAGQIDELDALRQVSTARRELDRLSALSGELLDLSRLDAAVPLRSEPVELGELVRAVAAEFELRARERSTVVDVILPEASVWGHGDPDAVARVVRILLDNALRYGPRGAPCRSRRTRPAGRRGSRSPTAGPASRPRSATGSSSASTAAAPPRRRAGSASGSRSAASWPAGWAASWRSTGTARTARASRSRCGPRARPRAAARRARPRQRLR